MALDAPLPRLAKLAIIEGVHVALAGAGLHLPQLTSLCLGDSTEEEVLRCGAMPALARLVSSCWDLEVSDSFAALRHLTHLQLCLPARDAHRKAAWVASVAPSLRSLSINELGGGSNAEWWQHEAAREVAAAGATHVTQLVRLRCCRMLALPQGRWGWLGQPSPVDVACSCLDRHRSNARSFLPPALVANPAAPCRLAVQEFNSTACLQHLPAWPNLQALLLRRTRPSDVLDEHVPLLAAAPRLRRLAFGARNQAGTRPGFWCLAPGWVSRDYRITSEERISAGAMEHARLEVSWKVRQQITSWPGHCSPGVERAAAQHACRGQLDAFPILAAGAAAGAGGVHRGERPLFLTGSEELSCWSSPVQCTVHACNSAERNV